MTDPAHESPPDTPPEHLDNRCQNCDSVLPEGTDRCAMCGHSVVDTVKEEKIDGPGSAADDQSGDAGSVAEEVVAAPAHSAGPVSAGSTDYVESVLQERQSGAIIWLTAAFALMIVVAGLLIIQSPPSMALAVFPTQTPIPPTVTFTPTWTPLPSQTAPQASPGAPTSTALPSATPQPPRTHSVSAGETLFGIGLRYNVSADSIAEANALPPGSGIQVSQQLIIPWPTATPPLVPVEINVGGETIIADPTDCELYEIKGGDTFFGIAARQRIDLGALVAVNRLTDQSILQPGDHICLPKIIRGGVLPPTPGPSPTPTSTSPPPGPHLLYPVDGTVVESPDGPSVLQWAAVKDLTEEEWYMVELTDITAVDSHPRRGFTRQTSFRTPPSWRPTTPELHLMRWRVTIVHATGERADGTFTYEFSGQSSQDAFFVWLGAVPTSTPTRTPTPTPTP